MRETKSASSSMSGVLPGSIQNASDSEHTNNVGTGLAPLKPTYSERKGTDSCREGSCAFRTLLANTVSCTKRRLIVRSRERFLWLTNKSIFGHFVVFANRVF